MKKYLLYNLRQGLLRSLVLTFIVFTVISLAIPNVSKPYQDPQGVYHYAVSDTGLYLLSSFLGIAAFLCPIFQLNGFKNKRNIDTIYSLPISRGKIATVHFISGLIEMCVIFTVSFIFTFVYLAINTSWFDLSYMPFYYISALASGFVMYSVFSFILVKANTVTDGVILNIVWIFAAAVAANCILGLAGCIYTPKGYYGSDYRDWYVHLDLVSSYWCYIFSPVNNLTVLFQDAIEINHNTINRYHDVYIDTQYMFIIWAVVGIAAAFGYYRTFIKKNAHKAGEISDSMWGYKLLIPLCGYSMLMTFDISSPIVPIAIYIGMIIGYMTYRKSFKLKKWDILCLALGIIPLLLNNILPEFNSYLYY